MFFQPNIPKVVLIGDAECGKTSIVNKWVTGEFSTTAEATVTGISSYISVKTDEEPCNINIWDTAGQERYHALVPIYIRDSDVVLVVASIISKFSIVSIDSWLQIVSGCITQQKEPIRILLINKIDCTEQYDATQPEIEKSYKDSFNAIFFISAKTGENLDIVLNYIASQTKNINKAKSENQRIEEATVTQKKCC